MHISDILRAKGPVVRTISPAATVGDLIAELAERNIGALPVVDDGLLVGIVSERDVVRRLHEGGASMLQVQVAEIMTTQVTVCKPDDNVADLAQIMTTRRFRHLPVVVDDRLCGIVSLGDLVKARIDMLEVERAQLASYIAS